MPGLPHLVSVVILDLLWGYLGLTPLGATGAAAAMNAACSRGFTVIRFAGTPQWPSQYADAMNTNASAYWAAWDALVADANSAGCRLLPSILYNPFLFADVYGESLGSVVTSGAGSNPSPAAAALRAHVSQLVSRYSSEAAISTWEVASAWNLLVDLNLAGSTAFCNASMGTPRARSASDGHSTDAMIAFHTALVGIIRANDTLHRPVSTGHALPRPCAQNLRESYNASAPPNWANDSVAQFGTYLRDVSAYADLASIHVFADGNNTRWNITDPASAEIISMAQTALDTSPATLYVGAFGDVAGSNRTFSANVLSQLVSANVPLATLYVWEYYPLNASTASPFSVSPTTDATFVSTLETFNHDNSGHWHASGATLHRAAPRALRG